MSDDDVRIRLRLDPAHSGSRTSRGGRLRLELDDLTVRETPAGPLSGVGLELAGGGRLDVTDAERLRDELNVFLVERGIEAR